MIHTKITDDKYRINQSHTIVSKQEFENIADLCYYIKNDAVINDDIFYNELSSKQSKASDFNDFENFEEALESLEYGTEKYFKKFNNEYKIVAQYMNKIIQKRTQLKPDVVGFMPIVPKVINNEPLNMLDLKRQPKPTPTAKIIIEKADTCGVSAKNMCRYFAVVFCLIQFMESKGVRCEIYETMTFYEYDSKDEIYISKIKLKDYNQPINYYKLQFPIISADMFRRIGFNLLESCQDLETRDWRFSYGGTLIKKSRKKYKLLEDGSASKELQELFEINDKDILVPNVRYFNLDNEDEDEDEDIGVQEILRTLVSKTNFNKYFNMKEGIIDE